MSARQEFLQKYLLSLPELIYNGRDDNMRAMPSGTSLYSLGAYTRTADVITADSAGALPTIDGGSAGAGATIILWQEPDPIDNGVYTVTTVGDGSTAFVLTRTVITNAENPFGYVFKPYPFIGSNNEDLMFVCTTDGAVNTDGIYFSRVHYSAIPTMVDTSGDTVIVTRSGQSVILESRDDLLVRGGNVNKQANTSFTLPRTGVYLAPEVTDSITLASNQNYTVAFREQYVNFASATSSANQDVDFEIPENSRILAVFVTYNDDLAGVTNHSLGWDDATTAFINDQAVADSSVNLSGTVQRTGSAGTLRVTFNAAPTAGVMQVGAMWAQVSNPGTVFFTP